MHLYVKVKFSYYVKKYEIILNWLGNHEKTEQIFKKILSYIQLFDYDRYLETIIHGQFEEYEEHSIL